MHTVAYGRRSGVLTGHQSSSISSGELAKIHSRSTRFDTIGIWPIPLYVQGVVRIMRQLVTPYWTATKCAWQNHPPFHLVRDVPRTSFLEMFQWVLAHCSNEELASFCSTMWAAWFCRNKEVMAGINCDAHQTAISFAKLLSDYQDYA